LEIREAAIETTSETAIDTATTHGAREHARAQAGTTAMSMRTVPATSLRFPPGEVEPGAVVWDEMLGADRYTSKTVARGTHVRFTDLEGDACGQLLVFNAWATHERLNVADTVKVQWQAYLGAGSLLLSDMGRVLATVIGDTSGRHDALCGATPARARPLLVLGAARHDLYRRDVHPCLNLFKGARVEPGGALRFDGNPGPRGGYIELRFELPAIVVLANSPHPLDDRPGPTVTPLRVTAWSGSPGGPDDWWRIATPEAQRAFENTEDWLAGHPNVRGVQ
jgi:uncharacterized protein YcgI (DUF1989 family)